MCWEKLDTFRANQIKKYEAGNAQPTLTAMVKLAQVLHVSLDELVFEEGERGPDEDLRLQFEAISRMPPEEKRIIKALLEGMIIVSGHSKLFFPAGICLGNLLPNSIRSRSCPESPVPAAVPTNGVS